MSVTIKRKMTDTALEIVEAEAINRVVGVGRFPAPPQFVAYYRVSTDRQGESGLGLEAQRSSVSRFIGSASLLAEFQEIESGKRHTNRPKLAVALEHCRRNRATLVIAKLDRLARNVAFVANLMESGVDFVAVDMPQANKVFVHVMAAFAEHEREMISQRTKAALGVAKARGIRLGNPRWQDSIARARAARNPTPVAPQVVMMMAERRTAGMTFRKIAADLNAIGIKAARGGIWHDTTVRKAIAALRRDAYTI